MDRLWKGTPPRLERLYESVTPPLYLLTFNTHLRRPLLARLEVHAAFRIFARRAGQSEVAVGRYVMMPDHVHLFVQIAGEVGLGSWVKSLKQWLAKRLLALGERPVRIPGVRLCSFWQPGFFDHLLRQNESYAQKWEYIWLNPVRSGLVSTPEEWPYQGEIVKLDRPA